MLRRIILLLGSFAVLGGALWAYMHFSDDLESVFTPPDLPAQATTQPAPAGNGEIDSAATGLHLVIYDDQGRKRGQYDAARSVKRGRNTYLLDDLSFVRFEPDGRRVHFRADKGQLKLEEIKGGFRVLWGRLVGNVKIDFDRSTRPDRAPLELRREDVISLRTQNVEFSEEMLEITSTGRVTLFSPDVDMVGEDLTLRWNELPELDDADQPTGRVTRELRLLRIDRGQYLAVKNMPDELMEFRQPTDDEQADTGQARDQDEAFSAMQDIQPLSPGEPAPQTMPATAPSTGPAVATAPTTQPASAVAIQTQPATQPTTAPGPRRPRNIYKVLCHGQRDLVHVDYGSARVRNAVVAGVQFHWDTANSDRMTERMRPEPSGPARPRTPGNATTTPATTTTPTTQPTQPAQPADESRKDILYITWDGPMVIEPVGYTPEPNPDMFTVQAEGPALVLARDEMTATGHLFRYEHLPQQAALVGSPDAPIRLDVGSGRQATAERLDLDFRANLARMSGPGELAVDQLSAQPRTQPTTAPARPRNGRIRWQDHALFILAGEVGADAEGLSVREAIFHEDVQMSVDGSEDSIRADKLRTVLRNSSQDGFWMEKGQATGNVRVVTEGTVLTAGRAELDMEPTRPEGDDREDWTMAIREVRAYDDVVTIYTEDDRTVRAEATRLVSDPKTRTAELYGTDEKGKRVRQAKLIQGENVLSGWQIRLYEKDKSVVARGAGTLRFMVDRDMDGNAVAKPRPATISWQDVMRYEGTKNTAEFSKDVKLVSGLDTMDCDRLRVVFEETGEATTRPGEVASDGSAGGEGNAVRLGMADYSSRRIALILANGNVKMASERRDPADKLLGRFRLTGEELVYEAKQDDEGAEARSVDVNGPGTLWVEDYRPPDKNDRATARRGPTQPFRTDRPSQTLFEWSGGAQLLIDQRKVFLRGEDGRVTMLHRSGNRLLKFKEMQKLAPDWGKVESGRQMALGCRKLMAEFGAPEERADTGRATTQPADEIAAGTRFFGPLKVFQATREVHLRSEDGLVIQGQKLSYDNVNDIAVILGFLPGQARARALLEYKDPDTGKTRRARAPTIKYFERTGRVETEGINLGG